MYSALTLTGHAGSARPTSAAAGHQLKKRKMLETVRVYSLAPGTWNREISYEVHGSPKCLSPSEIPPEPSKNLLHLMQQNEFGLYTSGTIRGRDAPNKLIDFDICSYMPSEQAPCETDEDFLAKFVTYEERVLANQDKLSYSESNSSITASENFPKYGNVPVPLSAGLLPRCYREAYSRNSEPSKTREHSPGTSSKTAENLAENQATNGGENKKAKDESTISLTDKPDNGITAQIDNCRKQLALAGLVALRMSADVYKCSHCSVTSRAKQTVQRHLVKHLKEAPFYCVFCKKRFGRSDAVKRHYALPCSALRQSADKKLHRSSKNPK